MSQHSESEVSEVDEESPCQDLTDAHASFLAVLEHNLNVQHYIPSQDLEQFIALDRAIVKFFLNDSYSEESDFDYVSDKTTDTNELRSKRPYIKTKKTLNQCHVKKGVDFDTWLQILQKMGLSESAAMLNSQKKKILFERSQRPSVKKLIYEQPVSKLTHKDNNKFVGRVLNSNDGNVKAFTKSSEYDEILGNMKKEKGTVLKRAKQYVGGAIEKFIRSPATISTSFRSLRDSSLVSTKLVRQSGGVVLKASNDFERKKRHSNMSFDDGDNINS